MIGVMWSNGKVDTAETWDELLEVVRLSQPTKMTKAQFLRELRRRAQLWSSLRIDTSLPARKLFQEMEWAKMIVILSPGDIAALDA